MAIKDRITAREADRIVSLLQTEPLPRVKRLTNRSWDTLFRLAKARFQ